MAGRPPSYDPKRANARVGVVMLPAGGRQGPAPKWPLTRASREESALWRELWASPQAIVWESQGWTRVVARYCRVASLAEASSILAKDAWSEARQLEDRLGLTPKAMRMLLWVITPDEVADRRADPMVRSSARPRLRAVESGS